MSLDSITAGSHPAIDNFVAEVIRRRKLLVISTVLLAITCYQWIRYRGVHGNGLGNTFQIGRFITMIFDGDVTLRWLSADEIYGRSHITGWWFFGFGYYKMTYASGYHYSIVIPLWFLTLVFSLIAFLSLRRLLRDRRVERWKRENRCVGCGYDLRSSSGQCPECGRPLQANGQPAGA